MKLLNKIDRIIAVDGDRFEIEIEFADGLRAQVHLTDLFDARKRMPLVGEILRGDLFSRCFVESGHLAWPNGFELCADALRMRAERQGRVRRKKPSARRLRKIA